MESTRPNPTFDPKSYPDVIDAFASLGDDTAVKIWGGDWCPDSRRELPDVEAVLEEAGIRGDRLQIYEVDREKRGPKVDAYDVSRIPTIVVERNGEELARFEEKAALPAAPFLADQLPDVDLEHY
ncbi:MAG: thioredoxin family protein [Halanaeroarchaeum sp.]